MLNHPEISLLAPTIENMFIVNNLVTVEVFDANTVELMATTNAYNSKFKSFMMLDDGTNGDVVANDGIYSAILPFQASGLEVKFYIRAENNDAIKLSPRKAEYEFYVYSPVSEIINIEPNISKKLVKILDPLGRSVKEMDNIPLFYMYDDGTVVKKIIIN